MKNVAKLRIWIAIQAIVSFENLVFLCLSHHDEYDSRRSQSKGLLLEEVREYRNKIVSTTQSIQNIDSRERC